MTVSTINQEREVLTANRATLMQRRGEVATSLRNEHIDGAERRELQEELDDLSAKIRSAENELATLDDIDRLEGESRRAAAIAETQRRRQMAGENARHAGREVNRWTCVIEEIIVSLLNAVNAERMAEEELRQFGPAALDSAEARDLFRQACKPLLDSEQIAKLLEDLPKGRLRADRTFTALVSNRVTRALALLPQEEE